MELYLGGKEDYPVAWFWTCSSPVVKMGIHFAVGLTEVVALEERSWVGNGFYNQFEVWACKNPSWPFCWPFLACRP